MVLFFLLQIYFNSHKFKIIKVRSQAEISNLPPLFSQKTATKHEKLCFAKRVLAKERTFYAYVNFILLPL